MHQPQPEQTIEKKAPTEQPQMQRYEVYYKMYQKHGLFVANQK